MARLRTYVLSPLARARLQLCQEVLRVAAQAAFMWTNTRLENVKNMFNGVNPVE